jgi:putative transposase
MNSKVKPSEQLNNYLQQLMNGQVEAEDLLSELMRLGAQQIIQQTAEHEVDDFLQRSWYERGAADEDKRGYRNGYTPVRLKTRQGPLEIQRPRLRDNIEPFESKILSRIDKLEKAVIEMATEMYVRGLSTRDIEQTLVDEDGHPILSRSSISRLTDSLYEEYERWQSRDLSQYDVVYLFVDGVYESVRHYTGGQTILCGWGICSDGRKVLLGLQAVSSESCECWRDFLTELIDRGLQHPLLVASDGGKGVIRAIAECFPYADRGRCISHKMRNLMSKLPRDKQVQTEVKAHLQQIYYAPDTESAKGLSIAFIRRYGDRFPSMVKCFNDDLDACLVHLKYPSGHRRSIRTTNLIERSFVEQKRRTKIIPAHTAEKGAMKLVYGVMIRSAQRWQRVTMSEEDLILLKHLRKTMCENKPITLIDNQISFKLAA